MVLGGENGLLGCAGIKQHGTTPEGNNNIEGRVHLLLFWRSGQGAEVYNIGQHTETESRKRLAIGWLLLIFCLRLHCIIPTAAIVNCLMSGTLADSIESDSIL
jgi:hypothetical protein